MSVEVLSVRGLRPEYGKVDRDLWLWFCDAKRDFESYHGPRVTKRLVQAKAKLAFEAAGITNFKASDGWYIRWLKRWRRAENNEPNVISTTSNNAQLPKKRAPRRGMKAKTSPSVIPQSSTNKTITRISVETGPTDKSSTDDISGKSFSIDFVRNSVSLQVNHENIGLNSFALTSPCSGTDLAGAYLSQEFTASSNNGTDKVEEHFAPDTGSLLNLDDIAWHDLSELSCFGRPASKNNPPKAVENRGDNPNCFVKAVPHVVKLNGLKSTAKGKGKLCAAQKSFPTYVLSSSSETNANFSIAPASYVPSKKLKTSLTNSFLIKNVVNSQGAIRQGPVEKVNNLHLDLINDVPACGNFVQHDLEDVSVSSDFVNQLNDEHSLELNLEYGSETLSHQILLKTATSESPGSNPNFSIDCGIVQPLLDNLGSLIPQAPTPEAIGSGSSCLMNVVEDDFSCEENDYISNAVMLSMQEDDFSILNCDQSPFQGTLSVGDENSQSDKMSNLDDGMSVTMTSPENLMNQEHVFYSGGVRSANKALKGMNSLLAPMTDQESARYEPSQRDACEQEEACFIPSHLITEDHLSAKVQEEVYCFSSLAQEGDALKVQDLLQMSSPVDAVCADQLLSPAIDECQMDEQDLSLSSSVDGNLIIDRGSVFQVSSSGDISLVENQDLFQISSSGDVDGYVANHDVFLTASSNNGSSLSSTCFTNCKGEKDPQNMIISQNCSPIQNTSNVSSMYFLPCSLECETESGIADHSNLPLLGSVPLCGDSTMQLCSLDASPIISLPEVTVTNADSTRVLLKSSALHLPPDQTTKLIALTSPNTCVTLGKITQVVSPNTEETGISIPNDTPNSSSSENIFTYSTMDQDQSSSSPLNCESTKENGFAAYDLQLVESVLSEQDDAPRNPFKAPKKTAACLTEKGNNTSKTKSGVEKRQSCCRRSSGDRYFPYFKEKVVDYAAKHTAKEAASYFGVNVNTVTIWTKAKSEIDSAVKKHPDDLMLRWLKKSRESGIILTREQLAERAIQLLKLPGNWVKDKSRWFHVWATRLKEEEEKKNRSLNNAKETTMLPLDCGDKKALYPDDFKVEVVLYAEKTSQNLAASIFNIARRRVFEWSTALKALKVKTLKGSQLQLPADTARTVQPNNVQGSTGLTKPAALSSPQIKLSSKGFGRTVTSVAVDQELWDWFCEQTAMKNKPKSKEIRAKAVELFRNHNYDKIQCSHGWLKKWSLRHGIALRYEGDSDLLAWCLEQFDRNRNIQHRELVNYAQEFLNGTHKSEFKGSAGWLARFCRRHKNLLSAKPGIEVEIPNILEQSVSDFRSHIQNLIYSSNTPMCNVGCMDELPLNFTSGGSRSRLLLRRSSLEHCHATVILSCLADGELLPPAVIFKGDGPTETISFGDVSIVAFYQKDCCMTAAIMQQWLELVWSRHVKHPSVLIADCYDPHSCEPVQEACNASEISLAIMPAGCSLKLQPLDLAISRLFEACVYNRWTRHSASANQLSSCRRTAFSNNADIGGWISEAYSSLKETRKEAIRRSFLVTGLTSSPNGSEDHLIEDSSYIPFSSLFVS